MSLVISNMVTCGLPKITFSLSSALMLRLFAASCRLFFLMYSQIFFVTSVRATRYKNDKLINFCSMAWVVVTLAHF